MIRRDSTLRLPRFLLHRRLTRRQLVMMLVSILTALSVVLLIPEFSMTSKSYRDPLWSVALNTLPGLTSDKFAEGDVKPSATPTPFITATPKYASSSDEATGIILPATCLPGHARRRC